VRLALRRRERARAAERRRVLAEVERDALEARAHPDDLARGGELVEAGGLVTGHAARQDVALPEGDRQRETLERDERLAQRRTPVETLPRGEEAAERALVDGLDLLAKAGEARAAQPAEDVRVAPLALGSARPELTAGELEAGEKRLHPFVRQAEAARCLLRREGAAAARPAAQHGSEWVLAALEEDIGKSGRRHGAEGVAVAARVLGGDKPLVASDPEADGAPLVLERGGELLVELARREVAAAEQQVVELVGRARPAPQLLLDLLERRRVEEVAQLLLPEQLLQQIAVEGERLGAALGERRVVFVHVRGDVVEEKRGGEGRRGRGLDVDDVDPPLP
jgi:hypothetical protein